LIERYTTLP
jgi:hypothetical protein